MYIALGDINLTVLYFLKVSAMLMDASCLNRTLMPPNTCFVNLA